MKADRKPVNLFFIEIIISLLVFSVSGAVILKVFATADAKSRKSAMLESVVVAAQSIAEVYSMHGDVLEAVKAVGVADSDLDDLSAIYLNDSGVTLELSEERTSLAAGEMRELFMRFTLNGEELYSLDCSTYVSEGGSDE